LGHPSSPVRSSSVTWQSVESMTRSTELAKMMNVPFSSLPFSSLPFSSPIYGTSKNDECPLFLYPFLFSPFLLPRYVPLAILEVPSGRKQCVRLPAGVVDFVEFQPVVLGAVGPADLWKVERKHDVWIDEVFGPDRFKLHSPLDAPAVKLCLGVLAPACLSRNQKAVAGAIDDIQ